LGFSYNKNKLMPYYTLVAFTAAKNGKD